MLLLLSFFPCATAAAGLIEGQATTVAVSTQPLIIPGPDYNQGDIGTAFNCRHMLITKYVIDDSYHTIDGSLIWYVGEDRFNEWLTKCEMLYGDPIPGKKCEPINIVRFVEDFQIPREVFEFLCENLLDLWYDYNLDVIYEGEEAADRYYSSDREQILLEKYLIRRFRNNLLKYARSQNDQAVTEWIEATNRTEWGVSELSRTHTELPGYGFTDEFKGRVQQISCRTMVNAFSIPKSVAEQLLSEAESQCEGCERPFDLALLYFDNKTPSSVKLSPYEDDLTLLRPRGNEITTGKEIKSPKTADAAVISFMIVSVSSVIVLVRKKY